MFWKLIGRYYAKKKNYEKAARYLLRGKKSIHSISDYALLAESLHNIGKPDEAISLLNDVLNKHPQSSHIYERRAHILRELYREEEAIQDLNEAIRLDSDNFLNWYTRGLAYKDIGKYEEAIHDLKEAIKREDPSTVISTHYELAMAYYDYGQYEEAVEFFKKTIDTPNAIPSYFYMLAIALDELSRTDEAIDCLLKGKEMLDKYEAAPDRGYSLFVKTTYYSYGAFKTFERMLAPTFSLRKILSGMYAELGEYENAIEMINEALGMYSDTPELILTRGKLYAAWGHFEEALVDFERVIQLDPDNYSGYFEQAAVIRILGEEEREIAVLEGLYQKDPVSPTVCYRLADVYFYYNQFEKALEINEELLKIEDDDYLNYLQSGEILLQMDRTADSESAFKKAIALYDHAEARNRLSYVLYLNGKYEESLENLFEASRMDPSFLELASYYNGLGHNYRAIYQIGLAIDQYSKAFEFEPDNLNYIRYRAECYLDLKEYHHAIMDCTYAIALAPEDYTLYDLRGKAYYSLREYEKARTDGEKYIQLNPDSPYGHFILGIIDYETMEMNKALRRFERTLELDAKHSPSYLYKAYIYYQKFDYDECIESIVNWALFSHKDSNLSELEEVVRSLENFDEYVLDNAIARINHFYGDMFSRVLN
jgi:tetratricopeptide (TPR) repeat protein